MSAPSSSSYVTPPPQKAVEAALCVHVHVCGVCVWCVRVRFALPASMMAAVPPLALARVCVGVGVGVGVIGCEGVCVGGGDDGDQSDDDVVDDARVGVVVSVRMYVWAARGAQQAAWM